MGMGMGSRGMGMGSRGMGMGSRGMGMGSRGMGMGSRGMGMGSRGTGVGGWKIGRRGFLWHPKNYPFSPLIVTRTLFCLSLHFNGWSRQTTLHFNPLPVKVTAAVLSLDDSYCNCAINGYPH